MLDEAINQVSTNSLEPFLNLTTLYHLCTILYHFSRNGTNGTRKSDSKIVPNRFFHRANIIPFLLLWVNCKSQGRIVRGAEMQPLHLIRKER